MPGLDNIKKSIAEMSALALKMWRMTYRTFMEHNAELITDILKDEDTLNAMEKDITKSLIEAGRSASSAQEKANVNHYTNVVGDLELIGDYAKDALERIEIKIAEKLLFSEEAVKEYEQLYKKTETALDEVVCALERDNLEIVKAVLKQEEHIDSLVDEIRVHDNQRLIEGTDSFMGRNMFLNILDFTAGVYYHTKKVARSLLKIKNE